MQEVEEGKEDEDREKRALTIKWRMQWEKALLSAVRGASWGLLSLPR